MPNEETVKSDLYSDEQKLEREREQENFNSRIKAILEEQWERPYNPSAHRGNTHNDN